MLILCPSVVSYPLLGEKEHSESGGAGEAGGGYCYVLRSRPLKFTLYLIYRW